MTKILGLSGKKQSGKNCSANWIIGNQMVAADLVSWIKIDDKGRLVVPIAQGEELAEGCFDPMSRDKNIQALLAEYVWPACKLYSFAEPLKQAVVDIFGVPENQVFGTDDEKNMATQYKWKQFNRFLSFDTYAKIDREGTWEANMTGRDIMQVYGTDMMRDIYGNIWVEALLRKIEAEQPELAIITDVRFPNEVESVQQAGGKVVRLLRAPFSDSDQHASETVLDSYPLEKFDFVLDNSKMSIEEQNEAVTLKLREWGFANWEFSVV